MSWDKRWMRYAFGRAAKDYDRLAGLQRRVGEKLLCHLPDDPVSGWIADVGAGTGRCARFLTRRYPACPLLVLDIAEGMLRWARSLNVSGQACFVAGDAEVLPVASGSVALMVSNLALQWCMDPAKTLAEMARVLQPGGRLLLSTFVAGTLEELRDAWSRVDGYTHVNEFPVVETLEAGLGHAAFRHWELTTEVLRLSYDSPTELFRDLKGIGAHNVTAGRPRHLMGKGRLRRLESAFPRRAGKAVVSYVPACIVALR